MDTSNSLILIVDDVPANQKILASILARKGYRTRAVQSGQLALETSASEPPDLVLLDINMPEMDGYETCRLFKQSSQLCDIPIIFISANNEITSKINGFEVGGIDYISKPFDIEEVAARVRTHLEIRRLQSDLETRNKELSKLEKLRDNLVHMVVHDMRTHLTTILAGSDLLEAQIEDIMPQETLDDAASIKRSGHSLMDMVDNLLDISRMESAKMPLNLAPCDLAVIARDAIESLTLSRQVTIEHKLLEKRALTLCDPYLTTRVINNLLSNALKVSPHNETIILDLKTTKESVVLAIIDRGPGILKEHHEGIFEKFSQIKSTMARQHSSGLGLTFCKLAMEAQQGQIGIDSSPGKGSRFWLALPIPL